MACAKILQGLIVKMGGRNGLRIFTDGGSVLVPAGLAAKFFTKRFKE